MIYCHWTKLNIVLKEIPYHSEIKQPFFVLNSGQSDHNSGQNHHNAGHGCLFSGCLIAEWYGSYIYFSEKGMR
jgi:hypothetical protein